MGPHPGTHAHPASDGDGQSVVTQPFPGFEIVSSFIPLSPPASPVPFSTRLVILLANRFVAVEVRPLAAIVPVFHHAFKLHECPELRSFAQRRPLHPHKGKETAAPRRASLIKQLRRSVPTLGIRRRTDGGVDELFSRRE